MSALSDESFSHYLCAEVALPFRAVAQRLKTVISRQCTNQFTDACTCGWELIYIRVY